MGLAGSSENLFAETPDLGWETPLGRYDLVGGHRLWVAPEHAGRAAVPDGQGLVVEEDGPGVRLRGPVEPATGLERSITVRLDPLTPTMELRHEIRNAGDVVVELAPWAISQVPLSGAVLLPQPIASAVPDVRPNRTVVLWPSTSWEDERLALSDGLIAVRGVAGPPLKVGTFSAGGCVGYLCGDVLVVRHFQPAPGFAHADLGCNVEAYGCPSYQELEILGPVEQLEPGRSAVLTEHWELARVGGGGVEPLEAGMARMRGSI